MGDPPSLDGAVQVTVAAALPAVAVRPCGAPGSPVGVTRVDAADGGLVPAAFVAVIVKVNAVPLARPATVTGLAGGVPVNVWVTAVPPAAGVAVTVTPVIGEPPSAPRVKATLAVPLPAVTPVIVGAEGATAAGDGAGPANSEIRCMS